MVVAILALLFTVGSFWWIQARRGRLQTFPPLSYAGAFTEQEVIVSLPLVLRGFASSCTQSNGSRTLADPRASFWNKKTSRTAR